MNKLFSHTQFNWQEINSILRRRNYFNFSTLLVGKKSTKTMISQNVFKKLMQYWNQDNIVFLPCSPNVTVPSQQLPCDAHVSAFYLSNDEGEDHCLLLWYIKITKFNCILIVYQKYVAWFWKNSSKPWLCQCI